MMMLSLLVQGLLHPDNYQHLNSLRYWMYTCKPASTMMLFLLLFTLAFIVLLIKGPLAYDIPYVTYHAFSSPLSKFSPQKHTSRCLMQLALPCNDRGTAGHLVDRQQGQVAHDSVRWQDEHGNDHLIKKIEYPGGRFICKKFVNGLEVFPVIIGIGEENLIAEQ